MAMRPEIIRIRRQLLRWVMTAHGGRGRSGAGGVAGVASGIGRAAIAVASGGAVGGTAIVVDGAGPVAGAAPVDDGVAVSVVGGGLARVGTADAADLSAAARGSVPTAPSGWGGPSSPERTTISTAKRDAPAT